jgi:hypothetical protein
VDPVDPDPVDPDPEHCSRVSFLFSISAAGALVCLDATAEPAGEGPGPHWSSPFHEEIFPHGAGMWMFHF